MAFYGDDELRLRIEFKHFGGTREPVGGWLGFRCGFRCGSIDVDAVDDC